MLLSQLRYEMRMFRYQEVSRNKYFSVGWNVDVLSTWSRISTIAEEARTRGRDTWQRCLKHLKPASLFGATDGGGGSRVGGEKSSATLTAEHLNRCWRQASHMQWRTMLCSWKLPFKKLLNASCIALPATCSWVELFITSSNATLSQHRAEWHTTSHDRWTWWPRRLGYHWWQSDHQPAACWWDLGVSWQWIGTWPLSSLILTNYFRRGRVCVCTRVCVSVFFFLLSFLSHPACVIEGWVEVTKFDYKWKVARSLIVHRWCVAKTDASCPTLGLAPWLDLPTPFTHTPKCTSLAVSRPVLGALTSRLPWPHTYVNPCQDVRCTILSQPNAQRLVSSGAWKQNTQTEWSFNQMRCG